MDDSIAAIRSRIAELRAGSGARVVFVINPDGALLASEGDVEGIDTMSLAERVAGQTRGPDVTSKLLRERGHDFHDAEQDVGLHVTLLSRRLVLVAIYDSGSSAGLVRLFAERTEAALDALLRADPRFLEIEEDDLDDLFD